MRDVVGQFFLILVLLGSFVTPKSKKSFRCDGCEL